MKKNFIVITSLILFVSVSLGGCINIEPKEPEIIYLGVDIQLNETEVMQMNLTHINESISSTNITFSSYISSSDATKNYLFNISEKNDYPSLYVSIHNYKVNDTVYLWVLHAFYDFPPGPGLVPEHKLNETRNHMIEQVNRIAAITNLTLNWSLAEWNVGHYTS